MSTEDRLKIARLEIDLLRSVIRDAAEVAHLADCQEVKRYISRSMTMLDRTVNPLGVATAAVMS